MKRSSLFCILTALALLIVGCSEKSSKSSSSTTTPVTNPVIPPTTTGGTSGGTTTGQPSTFTTIPSDNNWGDLYNNYSIPGESCSSPATTSDPNLYGLRKGTITAAGGQMYSPTAPWSTLGNYASTRYSHNTSYFLTTAAYAKQFFDTDAKLRVRFKVLPQPKTTKSNGMWCLGRQTGVNTSGYGYRNLKFSVSLVGINQDGSLKNEYMGTQQVNAGLNACTNPISFDGLNQQHPYGVAVLVHDVRSDQDCWYSTTASTCTSYTTLAASSCWAMDIHVSADDTVDFQ